MPSYDPEQVRQEERRYYIQTRFEQVLVLMAVTAAIVIAGLIVVHVFRIIPHSP